MFMRSIAFAATFLFTTVFFTPTALQADNTQEVPAILFATRALSVRGALLKQYGGSPKSEQAVQSGLKWLAAHQAPDGGWSFKHQAGACQGRCSHPGAIEGRNAATGLALLSFLGAGYTHTGGQYRKVVKRGIAFLQRSGKKTKEGVSWSESGGTMYSHGIALQALSEAYGMTQDAALKATVQGGANFLVAAQDPVSGGWRYTPRQGGDTSVTSWQTIALHRAKAAGAKVPPATLHNAQKFLDSVQSDNGAVYGYTHPGKGVSTTAAGLLCRMFGGWRADKQALVNGATAIHKRGPSPADMYYNYYASSTVFHAQQPGGQVWQAGLRDFLIGKQSQKGHTTGSWNFQGGHSSARGGRFLNTTLAILVLEVYYRDAPMCSK